MRPHRVLAVDNSPVVLRLMVHILEEEGCEVRTATDGLEALDVLCSFQPAILITDLVMPRIDGAKLCRIIRSHPEWKNIFLVVVSGVAMEDSRAITGLQADFLIAKGPGSAMRQHIRDALNRFESGQRGAMEVTGMQGLFPREVTQELLISKRHGDVIFAAMTEAVVEMDGRGRIVMANDRCQQFFELPEERLLARRIADLLPGPVAVAVAAWIRQASAGEAVDPLVFDYDHAFALGKRQVTLNMVGVQEDDAFFMFGILRDVSHRKRLEEKQQHLEREIERIRKLDAMSSMASGLAHDFNNLLTVISGNVEMAAASSREQEVVQLLAEASRALQLTTGLVGRFTTFSDNYLPEKARIDLVQMIRQVAAEELDGHPVAMQLDLADDVPPIEIDTLLMRQVFHNLFRNSIEAMQGQGEIAVCLDQVHGLQEAERVNQPLGDGLFLRIMLQDSGRGIPAEIQDRVFDPYFSTKQKGVQKGMGLGLTIVHAVVKKHGGLVWLESAPKQGCVVWLYLPLQEEGAIVEKSDGKRAWRVLVMDDDEMMRLVNEKMLAHLHCKVTLAENGEQAVDCYHQASRTGQPFDLVFLDLQVDKGQNGLEAARRILTLDPAARLVAVSGDSSSDIMINYGSHNFCAALAKPFSMDTVADLLKRLL